MSLERWIAVALVLTLIALFFLWGCSDAENAVTVSPKLDCGHGVVVCHTLGWEINAARGIGPSISGVRITCQCQDKP